MDYSVLGKRVRNERLKANLTQAELAEKVDVTTAYIGQIERGERKFSVETLVNIATTLNVSTDYLLRENMDKNTSALISELISIVEKRDYDDISIAVDIFKYIFERMNK